MKIEEIIGSLLDQIDDRESLIPPDDPDSIFKHDAEALREAVKILRAVEKEEKRIEVVGVGRCDEKRGLLPLTHPQQAGAQVQDAQDKGLLAV